MCDNECQCNTERMAELTEILSKWDAETFEDLVERTHDSNDNVRMTAVKLLMMLEDRRAVPVLIELMDDSSGRVRAAAALGLGHYAAVEAREVLARHLQNDKSEDVRAMCAFSLRDVGGAEEEIIAALDDPHWHVKTLACTILNNSNHPSTAERVTKLLDDDNWRVRYEACCTLLELEAMNEKIISVLQELHDDLEIREEIKSYHDGSEEIFEKYSDELEQFDDSASPEEIVVALREKYGEEEVPYPPEDPLGDMIRNAQCLMLNAQ